MQDMVARAITHGVYIVTARTKERMNGMTAAWVSQVSMNPVMLMVSIAPARYTYGLIRESGHFAINVLREGQEGLAQSFGFRSGRRHDKFQNIPHFDAPNGSPVLEDAMAFFECRLADTVTAGDHSLFIGSVLEARMLKTEQQPLIFRWDDYF